MTGTVTDSIAAVTLKLYGRLDDNRVSNVPVNVYGVSNTGWSESTLSWNNKPALGSVISTTTVTDSIGRYYSWDLTAYVKGEKAAGRNAISLALVNGTATETKISFNAKEAATNVPQLVLSTTQVAPTVAVAAKKAPVVTDKLSVVNAFPNPFSRQVTVQFSLQDAGQTSVIVYAMDGHPVQVLANEILAAGQYTRTLNGENIPAGVYLVKLVHNGKMINRKIVKQ